MALQWYSQRSTTGKVVLLMLAVSPEQALEGSPLGQGLRRYWMEVLVTLMQYTLLPSVLMRLDNLHSIEVVV